ncbi:MAG: hypothetical protein V1866_01705 [archaeon]
MAEKIIIDIEFANHLEKDCSGNISKLKIGLIGIKYLQKDKYQFFDSSQLDLLKKLLQNAELIIGHNLVGYNGWDYKVLENNGINIKKLLPKTYDTMTAFIRTFGSYKQMSLDSISQHTFNSQKKKYSGANYRLLNAGQIDKVKENLKLELNLIEKLFLRMASGGIVNFETSAGLIDEHEMPPLSGFVPQNDEKIIEPYDFPFGGMRLQIKEMFDKVLMCEKCKQSFHVISASYYGDSSSEEIICPNCGKHLASVPSSMFGHLEIKKV